MTIEWQGRRTWTLIHLGVAGVTFAVGLILGLARPESSAVRSGFAASMLYGCFSLWLALGGSHGTLAASRLALALMSSVPLYMIFTYFFAERFPAPAPGGEAPPGGARGAASGRLP